MAALEEALSHDTGGAGPGGENRRRRVLSQAHHARLRELFLAACERPPDERSPFMGEACGGDRELREKLGEGGMGDDPHLASLSGAPEFEALVAEVRRRRE